MTLVGYTVLVLIVAVVFYIAIPGTGAFVVRGRWRGFRARIAAASVLPFVDYSRLSEPDSGAPGTYRFLGRLEAMQGEDRIWVSDGHFSVSADLADTMVYLLPSPLETTDEKRKGRFEDRIPDEAPRAVRWRRIFSLPQGMQIFLAGHFVVERGRGVFRSQDHERLLAVIFDGAPDTLLWRATWGGRQRNEYWNQYTLASLVAGSFTLLFLSFFLLRSPFSRIPALLALTAAAFPVATVLPPGVLLYIPYRQLWNRARVMRAERDLLRLPLRYFPDETGNAETELGNGERYAVRVGPDVRCASSPPLRSPAHIEARRGLVDQAVVRTYGALGRDDLGEYLEQPQDPMAELVRIPGEPGRLARECASKARRMELMAAALIVGDAVVNLFLILLVLSRLPFL